MRILILALGSRGDIQPYATLGKGLHAGGHEVAFVTARSFGPLIAEHGLEFNPLPGDAQAAVETAGASLPNLMLAFLRLSKGLPAVMDDLAPLLRETDVVINQLPGGLYGHELAEKYETAMMLAAVIPLVRTDAFPMIGWPVPPTSIPAYNSLSYRIAEQMAWQSLRPTISRWRSSLGLTRAPFLGPFNRMYSRGVPMLNGFSAHVVPRPPDWGNHVHVTGYWYPEPRDWAPPAPLERFIDAGPPPVFIGFGSMPVRDPVQTTRIILAALRKTGQRAVIQTGWGDLAAADLPDFALRIDYVPYEWLFPRMAAVVHHGGSGTTAFGLRSGAPGLIIPFVFDQFYWGRRIVALGVGPEPVPFRRLSVNRLARALDAAVTDGEMRRRAQELGRRIESESGVANAVCVIEAHAGSRRVATRPEAR